MTPAVLRAYRAHDARTTARRIRGRIAVAMIAAVTTAGMFAAPASATAVPLPATVESRMLDHTGWDESRGAANPVARDCVRYGTTPSGTATGQIGNPQGSSGTAEAGFSDGATGWISAGTVAYSGHGTRNPNGCGGSALDLSLQSAIGFEPAALSSVESGRAFNLGRMVHRNNPLSGLVNTWFHGAMEIRLSGEVLRYDWALHETSNVASPVSHPDNDDVLEFLNTVGERTFVGPDGLDYTLVVTGFTAPRPDSTCAPEPGSTEPTSRFLTVESTATYGCLYAELRQVRDVTIVKVVEGAPAGAAIPAFDFASTSDAAGSRWGSDFTLQPAGTGLSAAASVTQPYAVGERIVIAERTPSADWRFDRVTCVDGLGLPLAVTAGETITLEGDLTTTDPAASAITCTYVNAWVSPVGSLTIDKEIAPRDGTPEDGYTGGDERAFAVDYACTLDGTEVSAGTVDVSIATDATVDGIPVGAACRIVGEDLAETSGDFADPETYAWDGWTADEASATVTGDARATLTLVNHYRYEAVVPAPTETPSPSPDPATGDPASSSSSTPPPASAGRLPATGAASVGPALLLAAAALLLGGALALVPGRRARPRG